MGGITVNETSVTLLLLCMVSEYQFFVKSCKRAWWLSSYVNRGVRCYFWLSSISSVYYDECLHLPEVVHTFKHSVNWK